MDLTQEYWEVLPESGVIFAKDSAEYIADTLHPKIAQHIVNMHNTLLDAALVQIEEPAACIATN